MRRRRSTYRGSFKRHGRRVRRPRVMRGGVRF